MEITIYLAIFVAVLLLCYGLVQFELRQPLEDFRRVEHTTLLFSFFRPLIRLLGPMNQHICSSKSLEKYRKKLRVSGNPFNLIPVEFFAVKELAAGSAFLFGIFLQVSVHTQFFLTIFLALIGFIMPNITLNQAISKRKKELFLELPGSMDLLVLAMEAGLGFTMALEKLVQSGQSTELNREFNRLLRDLKMGLHMREALRALADRTDMYEVRSFVTALIQGDKLGTPLARVLRDQADIRRNERFMRAEKMAQEAPVKMLFPLLFFIFPAVFIIILVPIGLNYMQNGGF